MVENLTSQTPAPQGLRRNYLSGYQLVFQSMGSIAPSACAALLIPIIFASSGNGTWLAFAFAIVALILLALQMRVFGQRIATPGALFVYVREGMGPFMGVVTAWSLVIVYIFATASIPPFAAKLAVSLYEAFIGPSHGRALEIAVMVASMVIPWWLAQQDVRLSTRVTAMVEIATLTLICSLVGIYFWQAPTVIDLPQLHLDNVSFDQIRLGLVLAFLCFGGFETATELGAEARRPFVMIPRALLLVISIVGLFYLFTIYGMVTAFHNFGLPLEKEETPLATMAEKLKIGSIGTLITIGLLCGLLASAIGMLNAGGRVLYALAHRGLFHTAMRATHETHATPHRAIAVIAVLALAIALALYFFQVSLTDIITYIAGINGFALLGSYLLVTIAAPFYLKKQGRLKVWNILSALATVLLLSVPIFGSLYPVPDYPINLLPYVYIGMVAIGIGYFLYVKKTDPESLKLVESELLGPSTESP